MTRRRASVTVRGESWGRLGAGAATEEERSLFPGSRIKLSSHSLQYLLRAARIEEDRVELRFMGMLPGRVVGGAITRDDSIRSTWLRPGESMTFATTATSEGVTWQIQLNAISEAPPRAVTGSGR